MYELLLTKNSTFIIGQVAWVLGKLMEAIFFVLDKIASLWGGTANLGVAIIIFTVIIYLLMLPLTIKQQKFSKLSAIMNPEIQAIQAKYKNNKTPEAMDAMNKETSAVYAKYGVSPTGSCLQLLIQMPILFALYRVIYAIPAYVPMVKYQFYNLVNAMMGMGSTNEVVDAEVFVKSAKLIQDKDLFKSAIAFKKQFKPEYFNIDTISVDKVTQALSGPDSAAAIETTRNTFIDVLNRASSTEWTVISNNFPDLTTLIDNTKFALERYNSFLGINIGYSPADTICTQLGLADNNILNLFKGQADFGHANYLIILVAILIPILAAVTQWIGVKLAPQAQSNDSTNPNDENPMMSSMKMMNTFMPLMSAFFCFTLPAGMGIYWIIGAVVRSIQQVAINKYIDKMDIDKVIEKNMEKYNAKLAKRGVLTQGINNMANTNTKFVNPYSKQSQKTDEQKEKDKKAYEKYMKADNKKKTSGSSIASKANMVKEFNERNNK